MNSTETTGQVMRITNVSSERVDRRRTREYALKMSVTVSLGSREYCSRCTAEKTTHNARINLSSISDGLPYRRAYNALDSQTHYNKECPHCKWGNSIICGVTLNFRLDADRPSEILSESRAQLVIAKKAPENEGRGWSSDQERLLTLEQILIQRVEACFEKHKNILLRADVAKQACRLADWIAREADERARAACNWKERLEALKVELRTQQTAEMEAFIRDNLPQELAEDAEDWHPEAVRLACEAAPKLMPEPISSAFPGSSHASEVIKLEDVSRDITVETSSETDENN